MRTARILTALALVLMVALTVPADSSEAAPSDGWFDTFASPTSWTGDVNVMDSMLAANYEGFTDLDSVACRSGGDRMGNFSLSWDMYFTSECNANTGWRTWFGAFSKTPADLEGCDGVFFNVSKSALASNLVKVMVIDDGVTASFANVTVADNRFYDQWWTFWIVRVVGENASYSFRAFNHMAPLSDLKSYEDPEINVTLISDEMPVGQVAFLTEGNWGHITHVVDNVLFSPWSETSLLAVDREVDVLNQTVSAKFIRSADRSVPEGTVVGYSGLNATVNATGWAVFNLTSVTAVPWMTPFTVISDDENATHVRGLSDVPFNKISSQMLRADGRIYSVSWSPTTRTLSFQMANNYMVRTIANVTMIAETVMSRPSAAYWLFSYEAYSSWSFDNTTNCTTLWWENDPGDYVSNYFRIKWPGGGGSGGGGGIIIPPEPEPEPEPDPTKGGNGGGDSKWYDIDYPAFQFESVEDASKMMLWGLLIIVAVVGFSKAMRKRER